MIETPHVFGAYDHLYGIHCQSSSINSNHVESKSSKTAVLMLTAGMLSNVGPSRLHVNLSRTLSQHGISSFRFDLSGIGESLAVGSHGASLTRATREVKAAIDMLERQYGYNQFKVFGLCSGADDAVASAINDSRIVAAALMDGCGYRTVWYWVPFLLRKYLPKVLRVSKWAALVKGLVRKSNPIPSTMPLGFDIREFPEIEQSKREISSLIDRGVKLHFVYTSGVISYYSYERQFYDMFPDFRNRDEISVSYHPAWDHVVMLREDRNELVEELKDWFIASESQVSVEKI